MATALPRNLSFFDGISLVVGTIVGSGIFASPGSVLRHANSGGAALAIWSSAGVIALCGALCYAELATRIPSAGGEVAYLRESYGPTVSFLFTWTNVLVTRPCALGIISLVFGEYFCRFLAPIVGLDHDQCPSMIMTKISAFICTITVTFLNAVNTKAAASVMGVSTGTKVTALVVIAIIGLVFFIAASAGNPLHDRTVRDISDSLSFSNTSLNVLDFPQAFMSALWAYDGWNGLNYAAEEMASVQDLVRVIKLSVPIVASLYFACNAAYLIVLPIGLVASSETVGVDLAETVASIFGRIMMSLIVCTSAFGAAMGTMFSGSRLVYSAARDGQLPGFFSVVNQTTETPVRAMLLQMMLTWFYSIGNFDQLISVFGSATWFFYLLTVLGLFRLRRMRDLKIQPEYTAPFPAMLLFCLLAFVLVVVECIAKPLSTALAFAFIIAGLPVSCFLGFRTASGWTRVEPGDEIQFTQTIQHDRQGESIGTTPANVRSSSTGESGE